MAHAQYSNMSNPARLAADITSSATSITLQTGGAALFPTLTGSNYIWATIFTGNQVYGGGSSEEIVKITSIVGEVLTVTRGQQGTIAVAHSYGDKIEIRVTASGLAEFAIDSELDATYATDAALAATTGATLVGFKSNKTNSVATTAANKFNEFVSVKDFGATGDGTTDDTAAIQLALDVFVSNTTGIALIFPAGKYVVSSPLTCNFTTNSYVHKGIVGLGATFISKLTTGVLLSLTASGTAVVRNITIKDLVFSGSTGTETGMLTLDGGSNTSYLYGCTIQNIEFDVPYNNGLHITNNMFESSFYNIQFRANNTTGIGILVDSTTTGIASSLSFFSPKTSGGLIGMHFSGNSGGPDSCIFGASCIQAQQEGIKVDLAAGFNISGCHVENNCLAGAASNAGISIIGQFTMNGVYGTTLLNTTQKYVAYCYAVTGGTSFISSIAGGNATVNGLSLSGGAGGGFVVSGCNPTYTIVAGVPITAIDGKRVLSPVHNRKYNFITYAATITPNLYTGSFAKVTLTGDITINVPSGAPVVGDVWSVVIVQDATGGRTTTWAAGFKTSMTLNTTLSTQSICTFIYDGTNWVQESYTTNIPV